MTFIQLDDMAMKITPCKINNQDLIFPVALF